jgi:CBS domain-containing protein
MTALAQFLGKSTVSLAFARALSAPLAYARVIFAEDQSSDGPPGLGEPRSGGRHSQERNIMIARDLMNSDVVTVTTATPLREVARTLLVHRISAVPVLDETGTLVGMVSEGDLVGRKRTERETKSEWWLQRLAEGENLNTDFLQYLQSPLAVARDVMSSPVLTVSEETRADQIAAIMAEHRIKRLPVLRDGRVVGIVRRADLLRSVGGGEFEPVPMPPEPKRRAPWQAPAKANGKAEEAPVGAHAAGHPIEHDDRPDGELTVNDFRHLVGHFKDELDTQRTRARQIEAEIHKRDVQRLIDTHISDKEWNKLVHNAREAAERGQTEFLLLRFPHQLCSDGGRAVNAPDPEWPRTLRGEAAEMYMRWERELRPRGFHLSARVVDFPDGMPGDIGLFLIWGE